MQGEVDVPEEAVKEAAGWLRWTTKSDNYSDRARSLVAAIAPSIRSQERQRIRESLEASIKELERPNADGEDLTSASVRAVKAQGIRDALAALNSLEDEDG